MSIHLSTAQIENFRARKLETPELVAVAAHLSDCAACCRLLEQTAARQTKPIPASINLSPQFWFKDDHLEYEELIDLVENRLAAQERQFINLHLTVCEMCRTDWQGFHKFVNQVERELQTGDRVAAQAQASWRQWPALNWKWGFVAAVLTAVGIIAFSIIIWRRSATSQAPIISLSPSPVPSIIASASPQPMATRTVVPSPSPSVVVKRTAEETLLASELKKPVVLADLFVGISAQRGLSNDASSFKLLSPKRTVVEEDRPTFRWERLVGATAYQVHLVAVGSRDFIGSERLAAETTQWTPATPLKRGVVHKWMVTAIVNSEEISAPAATEPELRFMPLGVQQMRELQALRKRTKSHLALGAFYARTGMLAEAEREFQAYHNDNPQSLLADKLLRQIQSWR